jgi:hypothetical protein
VREVLDPYVETARFAVFALGAGGVIFGLTTLTYFLDKRRPAQSSEVSREKAGNKVDASTVTQVR